MSCSTQSLAQPPDACTCICANTHQACKMSGARHDEKEEAAGQSKGYHAMRQHQTLCSFGHPLRHTSIVNVTAYALGLRKATGRTACADSSAMGAWQMMAVGRCAAWKCSRMRPRSLSSFRSSSGACPAMMPLHQT